MTSPETDAQRIRDRYPATPGRHRALVVLTLLLAVLLVGWMGWAGLRRSTPPVAGDIHSFRVTGEHSVSADVRVQRSDPSRAAVCVLKATNIDFVPVGELQAAIPPGTEKIQLVPITVRTLNRATTVEVTSCRLA